MRCGVNASEEITSRASLNDPNVLCIDMAGYNAAWARWFTAWASSYFPRVLYCLPHTVRRSGHINAVNAEWT
jgi:hypothetical protein